MSDHNYDDITDPYLQQVIANARARGLSPDDVAKAIEAFSATRTAPQPALPDTPPSRFRPFIQHFVLLLALAAIIVFLSLFWSVAANNIRIMLTLGLGLVMQLVAAMFWQRVDKRHMSYTLMPVSVVFQCAGWWALLALLFPAANQEKLILPSIMLALVLAMQSGLYRLYRLGMLFSINLALAYSLLFVVLLALKVHGIVILITLGISMLCLGLSLRGGAHAKQASFWQFIGGLVLYTACFKWVKGNDLMELAYFIFVTGMYFYGMRQQHKGLTLVSATAMAQYIIYVGMAALLLTGLWSFTLMILAIIITAKIYAGVRLWRYYRNPNRQPVQYYLSRLKWRLRRIIPFSPSHP